MKSQWVNILAAFGLMFGLAACSDTDGNRSEDAGTADYVVEEQGLKLESSDSAARFNGSGGSRMLDNMDVILVRGYASDVVFDGTMPGWTGLGDATFNSYWYGSRDTSYWGYFRNLINSSNGTGWVSIAWSSKDRLATGIYTSMVTQIQNEMATNNKCANGCIMVSHSTGGLVGDYLLATCKASQGTGADCYNIYDKIYLHVAIASANGGSELADNVYSFANGSCSIPGISTIVSWIFKGITCSSGNGSLGTTLDLRVGTARANNKSSLTSTPTLMVAGEGTSGASGVAAAPLLAGNDDSVVAMHSSCGANTSAGIESCNSKINITWTSDANYGGYVNWDRDCNSWSWGICNGYTNYYYHNVTTGPSGLYANHYPWIMSEADHYEIVGSAAENGHHVDVLASFDGTDLAGGAANAYDTGIGFTNWSDWLGYDYKDIADDSKNVPQLIHDHLSF